MYEGLNPHDSRNEASRNDDSRSDDGRAAAGRNKRRRVVLGSVAGVFVIALVATAFFVGGSASGAGEKDESDSVAAQRQTAEVENRPMDETATTTGKIGYADPSEVGSPSSGTLTNVESQGKKVDRNDPLFSIDNKKTYLFYGKLPMWRAFSSGMDKGPDIKQLEENLKELGYFSGTPDSRFNSLTSQAIRKWQKKKKLPRTGEIDQGTVVFQPGPVRIVDRKVTVGERVESGAKVLKVGGDVFTVNAEVPIEDRALASKGVKGTISLPDGTERTVSVASVGAVKEKDDGGTVLPVVLKLEEDSEDDNADDASLNGVSVQVTLEKSDDAEVLQVPVEALRAIAAGKVAVDLVGAKGTTKAVPIETGRFAGGMVEVTSGDIKAGQKVVVGE